jgi:hypothetical protein
MDDLSAFCCLNPACADLGKRGQRHNGTDRSRCNRKVRKRYGFSKDWDVHRAARALSYFSYNFCWPVRTLRVKAGGQWRLRTPAMAPGLTYPVVQRK